MAKISKRVNSDWSIGTHTVNSYKERIVSYGMALRSKLAMGAFVI